MERLQPGLATVTSSRRLAHWLRSRYENQCLASGLDVWRTPEITAWPEFIERGFFQERRVGHCGGRWLPDGAAVLAWERIVKADPAAASLVAPTTLGRAAHQSWRRMHAYEIPLGALDADERPEATAFARWSRQYSDWLQRHEWVDEATATRRLDTTLGCAELQLAGFDALGPAQQSLLARLASRGAVVTHRAPESRRGRACWVECRDRRAEFESAARWAARRLDRNPGTSIAIVVPGLASVRDDVRRMIDAILVPATMLTGGPAPGSRGCQLSAAAPLSAQPLVAAALEFVDAYARATDLAAVSRLLRSPFLAGSDSEAGARARLDARLRRMEGPDLGIARLAALAEKYDCPQLARAVHAGVALAQDWPRRGLPSRWSQLWFQLLASMGWPGAGLDSSEHQARERWRRLLAEVGASDDCVGAMSAGEAAALVRDEADRVLFEPQEPPAGLMVIDPDSCAGMAFDALWACGLHAGDWPPPASPDPFLPRDWQVRQRVPGASADGAAAEARLVLERLCRSADDVILSVPQFDAEAPLLPSALLEGIPRGEAVDLWQAPLPAHASFAVRPSLERLTDSAMPPIEPGTPVHGGARLLEIQSACPFRAQADFRLGARALEDVELGVAATDRGDLVHGVFARIWHELGNQQALRRLSPEQRETVVRVAIAAESVGILGSAHGVMRRLLEMEFEWLQSRVSELLDADLQRPPFVVHEIEQQHDVTLAGVELTVRVDRADLLESGGIAVIDYKTGGELDARAWLGERPRLPQLPLYAEALGELDVSAVAFGRVRAGVTGYQGLARDAAAVPGLASPGTRGWPKEHASWQELRDAWRLRLARLAGEFASGDARLAPDPPRACRYCPLGALCRIDEAAPGAGNEDAGHE